MDNTNLVDVDFLARFFGKDIRTVQLWAKLESMPKEDRGKYDFVKCVKWRIDKLEEKIDELEKGDVTLYKLKQEYQRMMNEEKDIMLKRLNESLVEKDLVELAYVSMIKMLVRNADSIVSRLTKKINGDAKTLSLIQEEIDEYKNLCANTPLNYFEEELEQQLNQVKEINVN